MLHGCSSFFCSSSFNEMNRTCNTLFFNVTLSFSFEVLVYLWRQLFGIVNAVFCSEDCLFCIFEVLWRWSIHVLSVPMTCWGGFLWVHWIAIWLRKQENDYKAEQLVCTMKICPATKQVQTIVIMFNCSTQSDTASHSSSLWVKQKTNTLLHFSTTAKLENEKKWETNEKSFINEAQPLF